MSKTRILRFTVGAERDLSIEPWRVWIQGNEVYFGWRTWVQNIKVSLHSSGVWKLDVNNERFKLNGRIRFSNEWDFGPFLSFPNLPVERLSVNREDLRSITRVVNLPIADLNQTRIVQILLSRSSKQQTAVGRPVKEKIDWQCAQKLRSGGSMLLVSYVRTLAKDEIVYIRDMQNKTVIWYKDVIPDSDSWANLLVFETPHDKTQPSRLISVPLGRKNLMAAVDNRTD